MKQLVVFFPRLFQSTKLQYYKMKRQFSCFSFRLIFFFLKFQFQSLENIYIFLVCLFLGGMRVFNSKFQYVLTWNLRRDHWHDFPQIKNNNFQLDEKRNETSRHTATHSLTHWAPQAHTIRTRGRTLLCDWRPLHRAHSLVAHAWLWENCSNFQFRIVFPFVLPRDDRWKCFERTKERSRWWAPSTTRKRVFKISKINSLRKRKQKKFVKYFSKRKKYEYLVEISLAFSCVLWCVFLWMNFRKKMCEFSLKFPG